jgi:CheY-like chemotaxis protein
VTEPRTLAGLTIALVEDDASTREVFARLLEAHQAEVVTYENGRSILKALEEGCPDILISDIGMPEMDGFELIGAIRKIGGPCLDVPAIALTAFAREQDRDLILSAGFTAHLAKPVDWADLIRLVLDLTAHQKA